MMQTGQTKQAAPEELGRKPQAAPEELGRKPQAAPAARGQVQSMPEATEHARSTSASREQKAKAASMARAQKAPAVREKIFTRDFNLIVALNFLLFLAFQLFPSALPVYAASIGVPSGYLGLISAALTLSALVMRPVAGAIADKCGRKGILIAGLCMMAVCTAAYALCPPFVPLVIIRFIQGIGWGASTTAASTIASDTLPRSRFGEGMGYFGLSISVALAIGPATGLTLLDAFGITTLSIIGTLILAATLAIGLVTRTMPVAGARGAKAKASGERWGGDSRRDGCNLAESGDSQVGCDVSSQADSGDGEKPGSGQRRKGGIFERAAVVPAVIMGLMTCTYGTIVTYLALTAADRGISGVTGFFVVYAIAAIISRPLIGRFIDRRGFALATGVGIVLMLGGLVLITLAGNLAMLLVAGALFGLGQGTLQTTLQTQAVVSAPRERTGAANATFYVGFDGGIGLGSVVGGAIAGLCGYTGMFAAMCALPVVAFAIFFVCSRR